MDKEWLKSTGNATPLTRLRYQAVDITFNMGLFYLSHAGQCVLILIEDVDYKWPNMHETSQSVALRANGFK